jgi:hypothetical protein
MVHVLVNLLRLTVLAEKTPQDAHPPHPQNLGGEPSLPGTPTLTYTLSRTTYYGTYFKHEYNHASDSCSYEPYPE